MAAFNPACASEITSRTPSRPRSLRSRRNSVQEVRSRSRPHPRPGPLGGHQRAARWRSRPLWRRPGHARGVHVGRVQPHVHKRQVIQPAGMQHGDVVIDALQIRDTDDLEIPVSHPSALTSSSTFLVLVPVM
jgi:hypothetical protein